MPAISPISLAGHLRIPGIAGESTRDGHEGEIEVHRVGWSVTRSPAAASGSGRRAARPEVGPVIFDKWYDASSPYIALAAMQGRSFKELVFSLHRESGDGHLDYLRITLINAAVSSYQMLDRYNEIDEPIRRIPERVGVEFERIRVVYVETREDHSAGDEHEIEYDVARGV
jgi:type VI secretion system secreted protein Hcp